MSHFTKQKAIERADRAREIIHELMECDTEQEFNSVVEIYRKDIIDKKSQILNRGPGNYLQSHLLNKSFENKN